MRWIIQYIRQLKCNHEDMEIVEDSVYRRIYRCPKCLYVQRIEK